MFNFPFINKFPPPSRSVSHPHEASTSATGSGVRGPAPPQAPNTQLSHATRLALQQFGSQAKNRANELREQVIGYSGVSYKTYRTHTKKAVNAALNAIEVSGALDRRTELRNVCIAKLNEIYRFATEQNGQLVHDLLTMPKRPLHEYMPVIEQADQMSAEVLKTDLDFLRRNATVWIHDQAIDEQVRNHCLSLISMQNERTQRPA